MLHGPTDLPVGLQVNMCPYRLIYCMSMFASHAYVVIKRYFVRAEHECYHLATLNLINRFSLQDILSTELLCRYILRCMRPECSSFPAFDIRCLTTHRHFAEPRRPRL